MTTKKSYDVKCYDLAVHFLADSPDLDDEDHRVDLAQAIQMAIEDWFEQAEDHTP